MRVGLSFIVVAVLVGQAVAADDDLIVGHVPAALLTRATPPSFIAVTPTPVVGLVAATTNRWSRFEAEFGIRQPSRSFVKSSLETAKYQLDWTSLSLQDWLDTISDRLQFDYSLGELGVVPRAPGPTGNPFTDAISHARLKSAIDFKLGDKAFVGLKLVLPIWD